MDLLNLFFPKKCVGCKKIGGYLCPNCFAKIDFGVSPICGVCSRPAVSGLTHPVCQKRYTIDGVFSSLVYKGITKKLVYQYKFEPYLFSLTPLLGELFYEGLIQQEAFFQARQGKMLLVPIPLHLSRLRKRGYNQASLLAKDIGIRFGIEYCEVLRRSRLTKTQVGLTQKERQENMKDAFSCDSVKDSLIKGITVFLVDDVLTSGATLNEAAKVLKRRGAGKVYGLTLAHGS